MYLMRPVLSGCIRYESLTDGTLCLADIALINAALACDAENRRRINERDS